MELLRQSAEEILNLVLTPEQIHQFEIYLEELIIWNEKFNLTSIKEPQEIVFKHFLDSLSCLSVIPKESQQTSFSLIDVGSGAGFPGIPLKIVYPRIRLTLVDSVGKKIDFCKHIAVTLGLKDVEFLKIRAEDLGQSRQYRESFDWSAARAVAKLPVLLEYLLPLVKTGGFALAQKAQNIEEEMHSSEHALKVLGGVLVKVHPVQLPGMDARNLLVFKKNRSTPPMYPRRSGVPSKKPLS